VDSWKANLPTSVQIGVGTNIESCFTKLDPAQWQSLIQHLLQNARFALAGGGHLEITLKKKKLTPGEAADLGVESEDVLQLIVRDNGIGMSPATLRRACEPFFSTRPKARAAGLGLTFVYSVVRFHGGQIVIESKEDLGTTVTIWVPSLCVIPEQVVFTSETTFIRKPAARIHSGRVLVVDDDPMLLEVLKACLQRSHFEVQTANDGEEGLELFKTQGAGLALVVCDVDMPRMDGIEMAREVRKLNAGMPILLMSGDEESAAQGIRRIGDSLAPAFLKKPFRLAEFTRRVQERLGRVPA
jgi:CheY-like chemotaxis protein